MTCFEQHGELVVGKITTKRVSFFGDECDGVMGVAGRVDESRRKTMGRKVQDIVDKKVRFHGLVSRNGKQESLDTPCKAYGKA